MSLTINFAWDPNSESDLAGYKIHAGRATGDYTAVGSPKDVGNVLSGSFTINEPGHWFFALTAYNTSAQTSTFSAELEIEEYFEYIPKRRNCISIGDMRGYRAIA